jgi:hypothetical protein
VLQLSLSGPDIQAKNFARFAFDGDFDGPAADFAVGGEALRSLAGVNKHLKHLPTKWALDGFRFLHNADGFPDRGDAVRRIIDRFVARRLIVNPMAQALLFFDAQEGDL